MTDRPALSSLYFESVFHDLTGHCWLPLVIIIMCRSIKYATCRDAGHSKPSLAHVYTRLQNLIRQSRQIRRIVCIWAEGTRCWLDLPLPGHVRLLRQTTKLCAAEWSTGAQQLYIKLFVHCQHSRVFPVYTSRPDRNNVWPTTAVLNNLAAMSQNKSPVLWMQTDVRLSADKWYWNFSFSIFLVRSIFTIRFFFLSLSGRKKGLLLLDLMEDWKRSKQGPLFGRWLIRWDGAKNNISRLFGPQLSRKNGG